MRFLTSMSIVLTMMLAIWLAGAAQANVSGAIFTTLIDGSRVNANIYLSLESVFLDGGPGPNAPSTAAGLPTGWYYFQVTDPSGKTLLSVDPVYCRKFFVNAEGVISEVATAPVTTKYKGKTWGTHETGTDQDHWEKEAITIQLMPFKDTPNSVGVYKVWVTPCDRFAGDETKVDNPDYFHGFNPAWSKTDNFKVKGKDPACYITVKKFYDSNANGKWDPGEKEKPGWDIAITSPEAISNTHYTSCTVLVYPGKWKVEERCEEPWEQTALIINGVPQNPISLFKEIDVVKGGIYEVIFGNICTSTVDFDTKGYWHNKNGLQEITQDDIDYVNKLEPYCEESTYFDNGDESFDGFFSDKTPVQEAFPIFPLAGAGTAWAEISLFLVDANAGSDQREQLAQQLLAFIFNTRHRLGDPSDPIKVDGKWVSAADLIKQAIDAWKGLPDTDASAMQMLLDTLNNNDKVLIILPDP